ncbi:hypothetical protein [Desulfotomaculum sp. 1211_IL3151]
MGDIYRQAHIYICASEYETFPLPPLEAMPAAPRSLPQPIVGAQ